MELSALSAIDYGLIVVIVASGLFGLRKGLVGQLVSLTSWIVGVVCAILWGEQLGEIIFGGMTLEATWLPQAVGSALILIVIVVVGALIQTLFKGTLEAVGLKGVDRGFGVLFGLLRGCLIVIAIGIILNLQSATDPIWDNSVVLRYLMRFEPVVIDLWEMLVSWIDSAPSPSK